MCLKVLRHPQLTVLQQLHHNLLLLFLEERSLLLDTHQLLLPELCRMIQLLQPKQEPQQQQLLPPLQLREQPPLLLSQPLVPQLQVPLSNLTELVVHHTVLSTQVTQTSLQMCKLLSIDKPTSKLSTSTMSPTTKVQLSLKILRIMQKLKKNFLKLKSNINWFSKNKTVPSHQALSSLLLLSLLLV